MKVTKDGLSIPIYVQPNAKKTCFVGYHGDSLKMKIAAPPVDGEANDEVIRYLSKSLKVPKNSIEIIIGLASRQKVVTVKGLRMETFNEFLQKSGILT